MRHWLTSAIERAAPALIEALDDTDEEVREYAREAFEEMGIQKKHTGKVMKGAIVIKIRTKS